MEHVTRTVPGDGPDAHGLGPAGVELRYWAGAADAAGCEREHLDVTGRGSGPGERTVVTGRDVREAIVEAHPGIEAVLRRCALLLDGRRIDDDAVVTPDGHVEVLPPFVGG